MDARTRERLPVLPVLVATVERRRLATAQLLAAARAAQPGQSFAAEGQQLTRLGGWSGKVMTADPPADDTTCSTRRNTRSGHGLP